MCGVVVKENRGVTLRDLTTDNVLNRNVHAGQLHLAVRIPLRRVRFSDEGASPNYAYCDYGDLDHSAVPRYLYKPRIFWHLVRSATAYESTNQQVAHKVQVPSRQNALLLGK